MLLSGKEIEVKEGVLSLLLFVPQFMEEFDRVGGEFHRSRASFVVIRLRVECGCQE
jgi:hypothetical protein